MFDKIKKFYDMGLYSAENVKIFVDKGVITIEEYNQIVETESTNTAGKRRSYAINSYK